MTLEAGAPGALPEGNSRPPVRAIGRGDKPQNARPFATGTPQDTAGLRGQGRSTAYSQVRAGMGPRTPETWAQIGHNCLPSPPVSGDAPPRDRCAESATRRTSA